MAYFSFPSPINSQITDSVTQSIGSNYWTDYKILTSTSFCPEQRTVFEGEQDNGYKIIVSVPGASKENISVVYVTDDNIIKVKAKSEIEDYLRKYEATYHLSSKYNLDEIQCSVKNGLLNIFVPYEKGAKPKEAKIS